MNSEQGAKPNIVLVLMDNLGWGELGVYGGGILRGAPTPRLDKLAAEGFRALNFNVEAQCTPSRAALMTGRYAVRTGNGTVPLFAENYGLTRWEVTLSEMLSQVGYATAIFGNGTSATPRGAFQPTGDSTNGTAYRILQTSRSGRRVRASAPTRVLWRNLST